MPSTTDETRFTGPYQNIGRAVSHISHALYELRQASAMFPRDESVRDVRETLQAVSQYMRLALGTRDSFGLLDLAGQEVYREWPGDSVDYGEYIVATPDKIEHRFGFVSRKGQHGDLYSSTDLSDEDGTSYWHASVDGAIAHLCAKRGVPPGGRFQPRVSA